MWDSFTELVERFYSVYVGISRVPVKWAMYEFYCGYVRKSRVPAKGCRLKGAMGIIQWFFKDI